MNPRKFKVQRAAHACGAVAHYLPLGALRARRVGRWFGYHRTLPKPGRIASFPRPVNGEEGRDLSLVNLAGHYELRGDQHDLEYVRRVVLAQEACVRSATRRNGKAPEVAKR